MWKYNFQFLHPTKTIESIKCENIYIYIYIARSYFGHRDEEWLENWCNIVYLLLGTTSSDSSNLGVKCGSISWPFSGRLFLIVWR